MSTTLQLKTDTPAPFGRPAWSVGHAGVRAVQAAVAPGSPRCLLSLSCQPPSGLRLLLGRPGIGQQSRSGGRAPGEWTAVRPAGPPGSFCECCFSSVVRSGLETGGVVTGDPGLSRAPPRPALRPRSLEWEVLTSSLPPF